MTKSAETASGGVAAASPHDTVDEIVRVAGPRTAAPLRVAFLQRPGQGRQYEPGPLAGFVSSSDRNALLLYLLLVTKASAGDYEARLPAAVWARALGLANPTGRTATSTVSRGWARLEKRSLITRARRQRRAEVRLLREDGSGAPYSHPGVDRDRHLKVPHAFWLAGPADDPQRWYEALALPEVAMLLIALSLGDKFRLPYDDAQPWYGISPDTAMRGLRGLTGRGLLEREKRYKVAPLAPEGYTHEYYYTLREPFGPRGVLARAGRGTAP